MMAMVLNCTSSNTDVVVASTHLKARKGELMRQWRNEQAKDVLESLTRFADSKPIICAGDFNADPDEPLHATLEEDTALRLAPNTPNPKVTRLNLILFELQTFFRLQGGKRRQGALVHELEVQRRRRAQGDVGLHLLFS